MSDDMYLLKPGFISFIEDDEFAAFALDSTDEVLVSFLGETVELYASTMTDEPREIRAVIQNRTTDNPQYANLRQMLCRPGTNVKCGNYVRKTDGWWMVPYLPGNDGMYEKAYLWFCNYMLKFMSPLTGEPVTYPVYTENGTRYNAGERETNKMRVGTSQHIIYIPNNSETILIRNGMRFILDYNKVEPTVMRVTQVDTTSQAFDPEHEIGILRITTIEDQFNEITDNAELGIADYRPYADGQEEGGSSFYG